MVGPGEDFEPAIGVFSESGATLHPIAAVHVADAKIVVDHGVMNVPADYAIHVMPLRLLRKRLLERANVVHRVLDLMLRPLRQRPITEAEAATDGVEIAVGQDRKVI